MFCNRVPSVCLLVGTRELSTVAFRFRDHPRIIPTMRQNRTAMGLHSSNVYVSPQFWVSVGLGSITCAHRKQTILLRVRMQIGAETLAPFLGWRNTSKRKVPSWMPRFNLSCLCMSHACASLPPLSVCCRCLVSGRTLSSGSRSSPAFCRSFSSSTGEFLPLRVKPGEMPRRVVLRYGRRQRNTCVHPSLNATHGKGAKCDLPGESRLELDLLLVVSSALRHCASPDLTWPLGWHYCCGT